MNEMGVCVGAFMTSAEWKQIKYFSLLDSFGDHSKMKFPLIEELDALREYLNTPILVTCGTQGHHVDHSEHHDGNAVDIMFPKKELKDLFDLYTCASRFQFTGIGIYPHWKYQDKAIGGLHLDMRKATTRALWLGVSEGQGQKYLAFTQANLKTHKII